MSYGKRRGPKREHYHRHIRLAEFMLACAAWQALDGNCRALYVELARRYRGLGSNNGSIPYSVREAADALHIGRSTAQRCFGRLLEVGFLKVGQRSGFSMKGRVATEWVLTEFPDDRKGSMAPAAASKEFMSWTPGKSFHGAVPDTHSPTSEPRVALRRDRVA